MEKQQYGSLTRQVGENLRALRKARGLSLSEVSGRMGRLGRPLSLNGLSKVELGNRGVDLDELVALARALGVPPLLLIFPLGREQMVEVLPGKTVGTWTAARWFTGENAFPTPGPDDNWVVAGSDFKDWQDAATAYFREQDEMFSQWRDARTQARSEDQDEAAAGARMVRFVEVQLRRHRASMRAVGLDPGGLTENLAHVDKPEGA